MQMVVGKQERKALARADPPPPASLPILRRGKRTIQTLLIFGLRIDAFGC